MKSLSFKKVADGQSELSTSFFFYKLLFEVKKSMWDLEIKVYIDVSW